MRRVQPLLAQQAITIPLKYENRVHFYFTGMWPEDCVDLDCSRPITWLAQFYNNTAYSGKGAHEVDRRLFNTRPCNTPGLGTLQNQMRVSIIARLPLCTLLQASFTTHAENDILVITQSVILSFMHVYYTLMSSNSC